MKGRKCLDCPTTVYNRAVRCDPCKAARRKLTRNTYAAAEREEYRGVKSQGMNPRKCSMDGCNTTIYGHRARLFCDDCNKDKRLVSNRRDRSLEPAMLRAKAHKTPLTEAEIDRRAIAIDKENRRIEAELAERAARLPSHLIAARITRGACVSVLY